MIKKEKEFGIYKITCSVDDMVYIGGTTVSFSNRKSKHWQRLRKGNHENDRMQYYWNTHGEDTFSFEILEVISDKDKVKDIEKKWLDNHLIENEFNCFNLSHSTTGGNTIDDVYVKAKHHFGLINSYTPELREKRRIKGIEIAEANKQKLSDAKKTDTWKQNHLIGVRKRAKDPEWLQKMKEANTHRRIAVKTDLGEVFESVREAWRQTGALPSGIRACINGKTNSCKGRKWEYVK